MQRIVSQDHRAFDIGPPGALALRLDGPDGRADIADLWRIPRCRWRLIAAAVALCAVAGALAAAALQPRFTAVAQILIDPRDRQIVTKDVTPDTLAADGGVLQVESQARVIESDAVLLGAVRSLGLAEDPDYGLRDTGLAAWARDLLLDRDAGAASPEDRALRALRRHLAVRRADKVFVVDIVVTASSGQKAARVADAIAEAYLADQARARSKASNQASSALASRLDELRTGATEAADAVERYKVAHDLLGTDKQLISDQQLSDNGLQLDAARARVAELQARADQIDALRRSGGDGGSVQEAIQSPVVTQLRASLSESIRRQSDLQTRLGARHPDLLAVEAEVRQARRQIEAELDRLARAAHSDLDRAKKGEKALADAQARLKLRTAASDGASVALQELIRERDARRGLYQSFLARAGETREQATVDNTNARIISRAVPPVQPSWPMRAILTLGAPLAGLGLGLALAFLAEYAAPTVLSAADLAATAGAPVIGTLPRGPGTGRGGMFGAGRRRPPAGMPDADAAPRMALNRLCGPLSALRRRAKPRTVLVYPARDVVRAGADVVGALARAGIAGGASTLLVGGEAPREPGSRGFLDVLDGACSIKSALASDGATGLSRMPAGGVGAAPNGPVVGTPLDRRFEAFLEAAGQAFDLVIFDAAAFANGPAALRASDVPDASPIAARVDEVVFAARRDWTSRREVAEAVEAVAVGAGRPVTAALLVDHRRSA